MFKKKSYASFVDTILTQIYDYDPSATFNFQELEKNLHRVPMSDLSRIRMKAAQLAKEANIRMKEVISQFFSFADTNSFELALNFHLSYSRTQSEILDFINKFVVTKMGQLQAGKAPHTVFFAANNESYFSWSFNNSEFDEKRDYGNGPF